MATPPFVPQGTLNRLRCSIVVPGFPQLNITSPFMGKSFASISFQGPFVTPIKTGTGVVTSPEPYVMATVTVGLLRTQALASNWMIQAQLLGVLGPVTIYSDTAAFPALTIFDTSINDLEPGAYDGNDPVVRLQLNGVFYVNSALWSVL